MSIVSKNQLLIAYKKLVGKSHTNSGFDSGNEEYGSGVQVDNTTIFADTIPASPGTILYSITDAVEKIAFELEAIPASIYRAELGIGISTYNLGQEGDGNSAGEYLETVHAYKLKLPSAYETNSSNPKKGTGVFVNSAVLADSGGRLQIIPEKYAPTIASVNVYSPSVFSGLNQINKNDSEDWFLDTYSGILFVQDPERVPDKIEAYLYIGNYLSDVSTAVAGTDKTVQFNKSGQFSGSTNLTWDYNNDRLGIGTDVPGYTLEVVGTISASNFLGIPSDIARKDSSNVFTANNQFINEYVTASVGITGSTALFTDGEFQTLSASLVASSLIPSQNEVFDLGAPGARWKDLWLSGSTIHIGEKALSVADNNLTFDGGTIVTSSGNSTIFTTVTASNVLIENSLVVDKITAREYHTELVSASIIYQSGSTKFGDTPDEDIHQFSGSLLITGSEVMLAGGLFKGDGSKLTIGNTDYSDGLFSSWNQTTELSTAIDKFNEVLKGLAPQPAPTLSNLETNTYSSLDAFAETMKLSFTSTATVSGYTNVTASLADLPNVDTLGGSFTVTNGDSGLEKIRLGVFATKQNIVLKLNKSTTADSANGNTNYGTGSFNTSDDIYPELYELFLNGVLVGSLSLASSAAGSNTYFNISAKSDGKFTTSGQVFSLFKHRTGTATLPNTATWRNGHNYLVVKRTVGAGTPEVTNYVDWVYDPALVGSYTFTPSFSSFTPTDVKWLSGIAYYTGLSYTLNATVSNYYSTTYPATSNGGISISVDSSYAASTIGTPAAPASSTQSLVFSNTISATSTSLRLLGTAPANPSLRINSGISGGRDTTNALSLTTETILLDRVNTANSVLEENFCLENYRVPAASYDTQVSLTSATFPSSSPLTSADLLVYNGALRYPTQAVNGGNIAGSSITWKAAGTQPNYSGTTGTRAFYRKFQNSSTAGLATVPLQIISSGVSYITEATSFSAAAQLKVSYKIPGKTGWVDLLVPDDQVNGGYGGNVLVSGTSTTTLITPNGVSIAPNEWLVLRITSNTAWSGNISKIKFTF